MRGNLAARVTESGDSDVAAELFRRALEFQPRSGRIRYNFGTFLLQQDRFREAVEELDRAINLGWNDAAAFLNRGTARWKAGLLRGARKGYRKALRLEPGNQSAAVNLRLLEDSR